MMVAWRGDKLGAAYYDTISHEVSCYGNATFSQMERY